MRKVIPVLLISTILLLTLLLFVAGPSSAQEPDPPPVADLDAPPPAQPAEPVTVPNPIDRSLLPKIEPQLLKKLLESGSEPAPFIVYLRATTNLSAAMASAARAQGEPDLLAKRTMIINALQQTARDSQFGVLQTLSNPVPAIDPNRTGQSLSPAATEIHPLWIINAIAARGSLDMVLTLAARPEVEIIRLDKQIRIGGTKKWQVDRLKSGQPHLFSSSPQPGFQLPSLLNPGWNIVKIRADLVHHALGINGTGIVVANMDTGVDWQHPALQAQYRGYTGPGKLPQHPGNWFDAMGGGATYPVDSNGHGTHTMGTMVGSNGVGMAPGAKWIAVKAFNSTGLAQSSWLHAAFQWLLAPNDDPALAPNVVNNSWSNNDGGSTEFQADVQALLNAGIYPIFAAGNNGANPGSVGSPGSYEQVFAVGAIDINDDVVNFSGRGPSPWGQIKPDASAPGKGVISTLPGGAYGSNDGTSMAAPHVAGLAALLLQASPALSQNLSTISRVMTSTTVQLGSPAPNNDYGWGRVDAYNAVMAVSSAGILKGSVNRAGNDTPVNNATILITPREGGPTINTSSSITGTYQQGLAANVYDATASAFGYQPQTILNIAIVNDMTTIRNFSLTPQPIGTLKGTIRAAGTNAPLAATILIDGTPAKTSSNASTGSYSLSLPEGVYTMTVIASAHRLGKATQITINDGATVTQDFSLNPAPKILLVDSGRWYQESKIGYYQQALLDALYPYDTWQITSPFTTPYDIPLTSTLTAYDIVIWSAPLDSPGYIGADAILTGFLKQGGKLLISGQNVAFYDGGGSLFPLANYLRNYLKTVYVQDNSNLYTIKGTSGGPLAGLTLTLNGGDGADNQVAPDLIANGSSDFAAPLLTYGQNQGLAGLHIGLCLPYRAIFLPFGFEAINTRTTRQQAMAQIINWFMQAPAPAGVQLSPASETRAGNFGATVSHTVRVRNIGANPDNYTLTLSGGSWPVRVAPPANIALTSCQSQTITLGVHVNTNNWHISDTLTLTAKSNLNPALTATVKRTTKSPAPVLLVDDDRWYSFAPQFKEALAANQIPYDYYYVPKSWDGLEPPSPSLETLKMYPMTVWYTGYDWLQPLTTAEEDRLAAYLDGGGRLFFSSQDYLYNLPDHVPSPFAQNYLGVLDYTNDYSSTVATGQRGNLVGAQLGPYPFIFPPGYNNWTDALTPTATAQVATRGQFGQPNGLTQAGAGPGGPQWQTVYLGYGPELLTVNDRARLLQRTVGWLSWLGRSTVTPGVSATVDGSNVTYTAVVINNGWGPLATASFSATFPVELSPISHSAGLSLVGGNLIWQGPLAQNQSRVFTYTARISDSLPLGTRLGQVSWLAYPDHNIRFDRVAEVRVNFPELETSTFSVTPAQNVKAKDVLTYTLVLKNTGLVDDPAVVVTNTLPHMLEWVSIDPPGRGTLISDSRTLTWTTPVSRNESVILTYRAVISYETSQPLDNAAYINDGLNDPLVITARATFKPPPVYFPILTKN